jgi:O-antigen/teichoic acid export membrane protein
MNKPKESQQFSNPSGPLDLASPHLSSGAAAILTTRFLGLLAGLLPLFILPRFLGPEGWGIFFVWISLWGLVTQILESSASVVMNRYLPILQKDHPGRIIPFQHGLLLIKLGLLPLAALVGWWTLAGTGSPEIFLDPKSFILVLLSAFLYSWACLDGGLLFNFHRMFQFGMFQTLHVIFRLGFVAGGFYLFASKGIAVGLFYSSLSLVLLYFLMALPLTLQLKKYGFKGVYLPWREFLHFGLWVGIGQFGFSTIARFPGLFAEKLQFPTEQIGYLGIALFCYSSVNVLPSSILFSLLPHLIRLSHEGKQEEFENNAAEGWRYVNVILFWVLMGLLVLAPAWFPWILGDRYSGDLSRIIRLLYWTTPSMVLVVWLNFFQQKAFALGRRQFFPLAALLMLGVFIVSARGADRSLGIEILLLCLVFSLAAGVSIMAVGSRGVRGLARHFLAPLGVFLLLTVPALILKTGPLMSLAGYMGVLSPVYFIILRLLGSVRAEDSRRIREVLEKMNRLKA